MKKFLGEGGNVSACMLIEHCSRIDIVATLTVWPKHISTNHYPQSSLFQYFQNSPFVSFTPWKGVHFIFKGFIAWTWWLKLRFQETSFGHTALHSTVVSFNEHIKQLKGKLKEKEFRKNKNDFSCPPSQTEHNEGNCSKKVDPKSKVINTCYIH